MRWGSAYRSQDTKDLEVRDTREAEKILSIISERGKNKKPLYRIYHLLYNPLLYLVAYAKLYANKGAMTKGITEETVDGMSIKKINDIIAKLRSETYRWTSVRRTYIKKKNGKQRPLGLPTWSDKMLQEVIRMILDAYYDCQFSDLSHGFRTKRGCKTALEALTDHTSWRSVKWFIEGDVADCFNSFDHQILLNILSEDIADKRFIRLIANFIRSGYMENWKYNKTLSGCPQGGVLSPLLSNVYLNKLDQYVEKQLLPKYCYGKERARNTQYQTISRQREKYKRYKDWQKVKELEKTMQKLPSQDSFDPNFRRLFYQRYADDWILGFSGNKREAQDIKTELSNYLQTELKLRLSEEKTLITHAKTDCARYLGYDLHVLHDNTKHDSRGRRCINSGIGLRVPKDKMVAKMRKYKKKNKPAHRAELLCLSDFDIVSKYQSELRGFVQYYSHAYNAHQMHAVKRVMEISLAKTLACKHKTTVNKIFKKHKVTAETRDGAYRVLEVHVERKDKRALVAQFGGFRIAFDRRADVVDEPRQIYHTRSQLIDRLLRNVCELCGAEVRGVEMHHVNKLKDLSRNGRRHKPLWMRRMIAMRRKTLAVCLECHVAIHAGKYDGDVCVH